MKVLTVPASLDGQTVDRSGVRVEVVETGRSLVTGVDGRFSFPGVPAGDFTLQFSDGRLARLAAGDDDLTEEQEDELEDADDIVGQPARAFGEQQERDGGDRSRGSRPQSPASAWRACSQEM